MKDNCFDIEKNRRLVDDCMNAWNIEWCKFAASNKNDITWHYFFWSDSRYWHPEDERKMNEDKVIPQARHSQKRETQNQVPTPGDPFHSSAKGRDWTTQRRKPDTLPLVSHHFTPCCAIQGWFMWYLSYSSYLCQCPHAMLNVDPQWNPWRWRVKGKTHHVFCGKIKEMCIRYALIGHVHTYSASNAQFPCPWHVLGERRKQMQEREAWSELGMQYGAVYGKIVIRLRASLPSYHYHYTIILPC